MRSRSATCAVMVSVCGALAACGSSDHPAPNAGPNRLAFSECMRSHGVPDFPDPGGAVPTSGSGIGIDLAGIHVPSSIDVHSPAFVSALKSCQKLLFPNGHPAVSAAQKEQLIAQAQCMRTHGVPNFPDPKFPSSGGIIEAVGLGVNPSSPAFEDATKACGGA